MPNLSDSNSPSCFCWLFLQFSQVNVWSFVIPHHHQGTFPTSHAISSTLPNQRVDPSPVHRRSMILTGLFFWRVFLGWKERRVSESKNGIWIVFFFVVGNDRHFSMIRCWVTHQQTWSKNCEFVTTSGSNTNNLEKIWMFGPWLPLMTAIPQRLEAVLKHHLQICFLPGYRFKQNYQNHNFCTWMYIWYLWASTFFPPQLWSQKSGVHFFPQRGNNTTLPVSTSPRMLRDFWSPPSSCSQRLIWRSFTPPSRSSNPPSFATSAATASTFGEVCACQKKAGKVGSFDGVLRRGLWVVRVFFSWYLVW